MLSGTWHEGDGGEWKLRARLTDSDPKLSVLPQGVGVTYVLSPSNDGEVTVPDHPRSSEQARQTQLDCLARPAPGRYILGFEQITALLARLGDPHHRLP